MLNDDGTLSAGEVVLQPGEYDSSSSPPTRPALRHCPAGPGWWFSTTPSPRNWEAEGWARDRIRELQDLRKSSGLEVSDRITVVMAVPDAHTEWAHTHRDLSLPGDPGDRLRVRRTGRRVEIGDGACGWLSPRP